MIAYPEIIGLLVVTGLACALFAYVLGRMDGGDRWQTLYIDEQNKRVRAEHVCRALLKEQELLKNKVIEQQKQLELGEAA